MFNALVEIVNNAVTVGTAAFNPKQGKLRTSARDTAHSTGSPRLFFEKQRRPRSLTGSSHLPNRWVWLISRKFYTHAPISERSLLYHGISAASEDALALNSRLDLHGLSECLAFRNRACLRYLSSLGILVYLRLRAALQIVEGGKNPKQGPASLMPPRSGSTPQIKCDGDFTFYIYSKLDSFGLCFPFPSHDVEPPPATMTRSSWCCLQASTYANVSLLGISTKIHRPSIIASADIFPTTSNACVPGLFFWTVVLPAYSVATHTTQHSSK